MPLNIASREEWVRARLREQVAKRQQPDLPELCKRLEDWLESLLVTAVMEELAQSARDPTIFRKLSPNSFESGDKRFEVRCAAHPTEPSDLVMSVAAIGIGVPAPRKRAPVVHLDTPGRYKRFQIVTDADQEPSHELLAAAGKTVLEAGGRWIQEHVLGEIGTRVKSTGGDLYAIIRQAFPRDVASRVWLYSLYQGKGIYVTDRINLDEGLQRARERLVRADGSPIERVAELATRVLDLDQLFAAHVLSSNATLEFDITKATYNSAFELAEEAVFHTPGLTVQPLVREGKVTLIATYPSELRSAVEPILALQREQFKRVLDQRASWLHGVLQRLNAFGTPPGLYGMMGEFAGSFLKQVTQP